MTRKNFFLLLGKEIFSLPTGRTLAKGRIGFGVTRNLTRRRGKADGPPLAGTAEGFSHAVSSRFLVWNPTEARAKGLPVVASILCLFFLLFPTALRAEKAVSPFDHSEWDQFLKKFVNEQGEVDYANALKEKELLRAYLDKLKPIPSDAFKEFPREERLAIFINAYNATIVQLILDHYPLKSIMDIPGIWDEPAVQIGTSSLTGEPIFYSLNALQTKVLRRIFRDEKIFFALSLGAKGSPPLRPEAYVGPRLEGQLYLVTKAFANNEIRNKIVPGQKKIILSRLFKWYGDDFLLNWGNFPQESRWNPQEMAVLSFFAHYLEDPKKVEYLKEGQYKVKYDTFDWRLNDSHKIGRRPHID